MAKLNTVSEKATQSYTLTEFSNATTPPIRSSLKGLNVPTYKMELHQQHWSNFGADTISNSSSDSYSTHQERGERVKALKTESHTRC